MLENIEVLCHNCIKISKKSVIYTDPFSINKTYHDEVHNVYNKLNGKLKKLKCAKRIPKSTKIHIIYQCNMKGGSEIFWI